MHHGHLTGQPCHCDTDIHRITVVLVSHYGGNRDAHCHSTQAPFSPCAYHQSPSRRYVANEDMPARLYIYRGILRLYQQPEQHDLRSIGNCRRTLEPECDRRPWLHCQRLDWSILCPSRRFQHSRYFYRCSLHSCQQPASCTTFY